MKVNNLNNQAAGLDSTASAKKAQESKKNAEASKITQQQIKDAAQIELSDTAKNIRKAHEVIDGLPEVNEDRIERLQRLIDEGQYSVAAEEIADKIVNEHAMFS